MSFAELIRKLMDERGLKQQQLSDILGIRQSQVSNWLNSKSLPGYVSIQTLCDKLNVESKYFFGR